MLCTYVSKFISIVLIDQFQHCSIQEILIHLESLESLSFSMGVSMKKEYAEIVSPL